MCSILRWTLEGVAHSSVLSSFPHSMVLKVTRNLGAKLLKRHALHPYYLFLYKISWKLQCRASVWQLRMKYPCWRGRLYITKAYPEASVLVWITLNYVCTYSRCHNFNMKLTSPILKLFPIPTTYRIAGNFREHKISRITNKHTRKKISRFLISRLCHDLRPRPYYFACEIVTA